MFRDNLELTMEEVKIISEERPSNLELIQAVEKRFEFRFPEYFVAFLLLHNGGIIIPSTLKLAARHNPIYLDFLYSIGDIESNLEMRQENETFQLLMEDFREQKIDCNPNLLIPFAFTQKGGYFFINCNDNDFGSIFYVTMYGDGELIKTEFIDIDDMLSSVVFYDDVDYENYIANYLPKKIYQFQQTKYIAAEHERIYLKRFKEILSHIKNIEMIHPQNGKLTDYYINNPKFLKYLLDAGAQLPRNLEKLNEEESRKIITSWNQ